MLNLERLNSPFSRPGHNMSRPICQRLGSLNITNHLTPNGACMTFVISYNVYIEEFPFPEPLAALIHGENVGNTPSCMLI